MPRGGSTLYVETGIPIPILNEELAQRTAISDEGNHLPHSRLWRARRSKPIVREANYHELKSGVIELNGVEVPTSPLSNQKKALEIALKLKEWIDKGEFLLTIPVEKPLQ